MKKFVNNKLNNYIKESFVDENGNLKDMCQDDINEILRGYIDAALWTEEERLSEGRYQLDVNDDEDDMDEFEKLISLKTNFNQKQLSAFISDDIDVDSRIEAYLDIKKFIKAAGDDAIVEAIDENGLFQLGMDIWLSRNGHGAGFFDNSYQFEDELTTAAKNLKSKDLIIGDDGMLYFE